MKKILVNALSPEVRIAIIEDGQLAEFYVERKGRRGIVGNIYKGRVLKIIPAIQAAFVDIGEHRSAFLYVRDAVPKYECEGVFEEEEQEEIPPIEEVLTEGQEIIVQVIKEPIGTKGPRITTNVTLAGHYTILLPTVEKVGVSRRIKCEDERARLKAIGQSLKPSGLGVIMRTASEGVSQFDIAKDLTYLEKLWKRLSLKAQMKKAPSLIYRELDIVPKVVRDFLTPDVEEVLIDSVPEYTKARSFARAFVPELFERIKLYSCPKPLFEKFKIEESIEKALSRKVSLPGGGYIVIDETEALVSIDVNSGKFKKTNNLEDTAFEVNRRAAKEIARQLRLRDIGGIIVIDFIDMKDEENKKKLLEILEHELSKDRAKTKIVSMSDLGLVEMTRKRVKKSLGRSLTMTCPYCEGSGRIKSIDTIVFEIERKLLRELNGLKSDLKLFVNPVVARRLSFEEREFLERFEKIFGMKIEVVPDAELHIEKFKIVREKR